MPIFVARLLQGAAWALVFPVSLAAVAELAPPSRLAQSLSLFSSSNLATNAIGPVLAERLLTQYGPDTVFSLGAGFGLLGLGFASLFRRRFAVEHPLVAQPRVRPRERPIPSVASRAGAVAPLSAKATSGAVPRFRGRGLACAVMFSFYQPFALTRGATTVSGFLVLYTVAALGIRVVMGRQMDRIGALRVCRSSLLIYGVVVASMAIMSPGALLVMGFLFGISHGVYFPANMALYMEALPQARQWAANYANTGFHLGGLLVFPLGLLVPHIGYPAAFVGTGVLTAGAALLLAPRWAARSTRT